MAITYYDKNILLEFLKSIFSIVEVSEAHETICSLPWRRIYTTNYDNTIEFASAKVSKRIESVDLSYDPSKYLKTENLCLHINGKLEGSIVEDLEDKIKLSDSSYLSADSFVNSRWYYHFKRDLNKASAIIFVGYSMYDVDIKKIFFENPELAEKTYFIVRADTRIETVYTLRKFGSILQCGVDGFADLVKSLEGVKPNTSDEVFVSSLVKYSIDRSNDTPPLQDKDSEKFLLYGRYSSINIQQALEKSHIPFMVQREALLECLEHINRNKNILIQADLGNGKSIFLESLAYFLTTEGYDTYTIVYDDSYVEELEKINKLDKKSIVLVDDYSKFKDILEYIKYNQPQNIQFVFSERNASYSNNLNDIGIEFIDINIDLLTNNEIREFINIIDNLAIWKEFSSLTPANKIRKIESTYGAQLSTLLLGILDSPNIKAKIQTQTDMLYSNALYKKTIFIICLCEILNATPEFSLIDELAGNDEIYKINLRNTVEFKNLFDIQRSQIVSSKSSILGLSLLNNTFSPHYVVNSLLEVVEKLEIHKSRDGESLIGNLQKPLLRFNLIERILPGKKDSLNFYYEHLKIRLPWLMKSPHYWVQYAMCRLSFKDYIKAQDYLDTAYEHAKAKTGEYHTDNIDTQQARLHLELCLEAVKSDEIYRLFNLAHMLLIDLPNDGRKFRQVILYEDVYKQKYKHLKPGYQVKFLHGVTALLAQIAQGDMNPANLHHAKQLHFIERAKISLQKIHDDIKQ
nr:SIR2 family protein [Wohlfahrtiimonas chitiniclastica]